ncbi:hypothetical protein CLV36_103139 [Laceyella sediminis]|jgi:hypothetical protein|uniref:Uncharacterized protein n=2 Tax=Laceyella TaxID=292635 RepID=A0AA45WKB8_9BACL|nr:hypothetical protein CLV36_103139 [Laceyella sediminis]SMP06182.1 hypothetical protein SAMN06265361_101679 [Laceyella tengchongensis]
MTPFITNGLIILFVVITLFYLVKDYVEEKKKTKS